MFRHVFVTNNKLENIKFYFNFYFSKGTWAGLRCVRVEAVAWVDHSGCDKEQKTKQQVGGGHLDLVIVTLA